jgi:hypothetical protein
MGDERICLGLEGQERRKGFGSETKDLSKLQRVSRIAFRMWLFYSTILLQEWRMVRMMRFFAARKTDCLLHLQQPNQ